MAARGGREGRTEEEQSGGGGGEWWDAVLGEDSASEFDEAADEMADQGVGESAVDGRGEALLLQRLRSPCYRSSLSALRSYRLSPLYTARYGCDRQLSGAAARSLVQVKWSSNLLPCVGHDFALSPAHEVWRWP